MKLLFAPPLIGCRGLILTLLFTSVGVSRADDIVLGTSAAFKGPSRALGIELYRGSMAYFEEVNKNGGIHGRKVVIKAYDDNYNPLPCIDNTIRLMEQDKVLLLFNYVGTPTVTRTLPLLKRYNDQSFFLFFPFTGAQPQRQAPYGDFVYNFRASYYEETAGLVDHFVGVGRKRIAVFYQIDAYGRNGWEGVRNRLGKHDLKMVGEATYKRGTSYADSLKGQVDALRKTDPDAIISIGAYAACAAFIRDARNTGWDVPIANVSFVGSESMLDLLLATGKSTGNDYTQNLINSQVVPSYHDLKLPAVLEYRKLMERHNPKTPPDLREDDYEAMPYSFVGLEGFLNAKLLTAILNKMEPPFERKRLKEATEALGKLDLGIEMPVQFGPDRHQASDAVYFTVVAKDRFVPLPEKDWARWRK